MGRGIAQINAQAGFAVRLVDAKPGAAADAKRAIADVLATLAAKGKIAAASADAAVARIALPETLDGLAGCSIVIEAIVERLDAKQALFPVLEAIVGDQCILATNTSSLSVTAIASACAHPERVAGLHFFSPVPLMKLVEVIDGLLTTSRVIARLLDFGAALGHTPIRAKDTPGFIVNHAGRGYGTEALRIAGEGIAEYATIDRILKRAAGFRMGPFELFDLTGLDVSHPVMESIYHQFYEEPRFRPSPATAQRLAAGVLGRKSGRGFYDYRDATTEVTAPALVNARPAERIWIGRGEPQSRAAVEDLLRALGARLDGGSVPTDALCLVLPLGRDATAATLDEHLVHTHGRARHTARSWPPSHADDDAGHCGRATRRGARAVRAGRRRGRRHSRQPGLCRARARAYRQRSQRYRAAAYRQSGRHRPRGHARARLSARPARVG
jgi:3-hydroxybutyryl-CoA dehydrogenase